MRKLNFSSKQWLFIGFLSLVFLYSLFQARFVILGPQIKIANPQNGASIPAGPVVIDGTARNVAWLTLNDRQIFTDENGKWSEKLIASPGISIITLKARDRFGRTKTKSVEIYAQ